VIVASVQTRLVTVSASYGAGGSVVAPALAQRLGVPFVQRATSAGGIGGECGPCTERLATAESRMAPAHRVLASLIQAMPAGPTQSPPSARHHDESLRRACEKEIHDLAGAGAGVILGRGAAVVLGKDRGFHIRLDGPPGQRVLRGAAIEGVSQDQARRHMEAADRARTAYVRRLYRADPGDPRHYHLVIDSTAIPLDTVIEIILSALSARAPITEPAAPGGPSG
jgi:cytidylate kinase